MWWLCVHLIFNAYSAQASDWPKDALKLSGESTLVYQETIKRLEQNPTLDTEIREALTHLSINTYLALDVIAVLKRESLFPDLFTAAKKDRTGFFLIALNSFFNSSHHQEILQYYENELKDETASSAKKIVMLDTLARIRVRIPLPELKKIIQQNSEPELQGAALSYLRTFVKMKDPEYSKFLSKIQANHRPNPAQETLEAQLNFLISETRGDNHDSAHGEKQ